MGLDKDTLLGLGVLITLLILVSAISFLLSSVEGFLAGVFVIFIGFLISFFRDDIKRALGVSKEEPEIPAPEAEEKDPLYDIEKRISKGREKVAKSFVKYESEYKPEKKGKRAQDIYQEASRLLAALHQAKTYAIQQRNSELVDHYEELIQEVEETRDWSAEEMKYAS
ncbi:hypothetical protein EU537_08245 [Candidatus Thorarchaeota archaeon]|nr:MAG: hypothetical protein EU537_08245 [Candidatus Thorarchaeota archaeon]